MRKRRTTVYLSQLKDLAVLFPGDLYRLAEFIIDCSEAADKINSTTNRSNVRHSRPTLNGLARDFEILTKTPRLDIEKQLDLLGVDLNSAVELDKFNSRTKTGNHIDGNDS
jgi:hypothetical protein